MAEMKFRTIAPGRYITVFTDASHCPTIGAYGWCFWVKHGEPAKTVVRSGGGAYLNTSNAAEVEGILQALDFVKTLPIEGKSIVVQSDCLGALSNVQVIAKLKGLEKLGAVRAYSKHVYAHKGNATPRNAVNTLCDRKARIEMKKFRNLVAP